MSEALRLMVVAAHPDDETLGFGAVLARYASEGVETFLVTATRGERGRYLDHRPGQPRASGRGASGARFVNASCARPPWRSASAR